MNTYYGLRHGESEANVKGLIVSLPANGLGRFGLTPHGTAQVAASCEKMPIKSPVIVASDFKRTVETAVIAANIYQTNYTTNPLLRERDFTAFELQPNTHYQFVWRHDSQDRALKDVETTSSVARRCKSLIAYLEESYSDKNILLVSHGDTLQIMQCVLQGLSPSEHRDIRHFLPGELRVFSA